MADEVVEFLRPAAGKTIVDCTLGGGGHTQALLTSPLHPSPLSWRGESNGSPLVPPLHDSGEGDTRREGVRIIGFDQDEEAIYAARERLKTYHDIEYINDNFSNLKKYIKKKVDGFLFDLGVSSHHIDSAERGFSLQSDGPLDMRMDRRQKLTAAEIVNHYSIEDLADIFKEYSEERFSRRIASAIGRSRPLHTTLQLKDIIERAIPTWKKRESVTRIFQALRIAVNSELFALSSALADAIALLKARGRIVVLSYHSLEDRIVKHAFKAAEKDGILKIMTKKPLTADLREIELNPRARSAKLRAAEKI